MALKVNTNAIRTAATSIAKKNKNIKDDFSSVEKVMNELDANWEGTASNSAISKYKNIKNTYYNNRYEVINDMVNFMKKQAGDGYENVETTVVSAASAFK